MWHLSDHKRVIDVLFADGTAAALNPLDRFFPFDPYRLRHSSKYTIPFTPMHTSLTNLTSAYVVAIKQ
jgi:hypothetical protein